MGFLPCLTNIPTSILAWRWNKHDWGKDIKTQAGTLRFGLVGGASGSIIADVHRKAALFDGQADLSAGCFSSKFERTLETGNRLGLDPLLLYRDHGVMAEMEAALEDGIDFVIIASPNYHHYAAAKAFLLSGSHVVCDKPLTLQVEVAEELASLAEE